MVGGFKRKPTKTNMDPTYHWDITQGTPEWDAIRRGVITASAMKVLVTPTGKPANNDTSRAYLAQLLAERITGTSDSSYCSNDMLRGHMLEPYARDLYATHYHPVTECGFIQRHYEGFTIGFSPDGVVGDDGLIEIKSRLAKHHVKNILEGGIPSEFAIQIQTGLLVTGRSWLDFASYTPGLPLYICRAHRCHSMIAAIEAAATRAEEQLQEMMERYLSVAETMPPTEPLIQSSFTDEDIIQ
jgi:predicted phage-related endonuclease